MAVIIDVISSNLWRSLEQAVMSCLMVMLSVMPPVRSARPSSNEPYLRASYEPCNLQKNLKKLVLCRNFDVIIRFVEL